MVLCGNSGQTANSRPLGRSRPAPDASGCFRMLPDASTRVTKFSAAIFLALIAELLTTAQ
jgi:hypothetical protein